MTASKKVCQYIFYLLAAFVWITAADTPTGFFRELCSYRKSQLIQPVSVYRERLAKLREEMKIRSTLREAIIDGYILPSTDEHLNQELLPSDRRLHYLTGFTGIKAVAVVTLKRAAIWVENRYVQQADGELTCDWEIYRANDTITIPDWLESRLMIYQKVGADPRLVPHQQWMHWERELKDRLLFLKKIEQNLVDFIWKDRPVPHFMQIEVHEKKYAGQQWEDKVEELRKYLLSEKCDAMIITALTEIAYLLNIRGRDIPYTPVVKSYLLVSHTDIYFYVNRNKSDIIDWHLNIDCYNQNCVKIKNYNQVWNDLDTYRQIWRRVLVPAPCVQEPGASEAIFSALPVDIVYEHISPIIFMRAQKNSDEQRGMRMAHIRDGAAICEAMSNLETKFFTEKWSEETIKFELELSRLKQSNARELSLRTVVAFGAHSSLPYYISSNITDIEVNKSSLLVLESGSQYYEGTTDVSRTFMFGEPTPEMKKAYTNVLAGILELSQLKFPANLEPSKVDAIVRSPVWKAMSDYPQTTGHGIGCFGAVEEPPISVAYGSNSSFLFKEGYFFSSESGFYKSGSFGVRLKNVLEVIDTGKSHPFSGKFLAFEDVTLVPYEPKLIDGTLLSAVDKRRLNDYNAKIRINVGQELKRQGNMIAFHWMMSKTRHIREYLPEEEYKAAMGAGSKQRISKIMLSLILVLSCFY